MLFEIFDDLFADHLALKATQRALDRFVRIYCNKSHFFTHLLSAGICQGKRFSVPGFARKEQTNITHLFGQNRNLACQKHFQIHGIVHFYTIRAVNCRKNARKPYLFSMER